MFGLATVSTIPRLLRPLALILSAFLMLLAADLHAGENVVLRESFAGPIDFELAGNSLRTGTNGCSILGSSSDSISIPNGSTITKAYRYWASSGPTADTRVNVNGTAVISMQALRLTALTAQKSAARRSAF